MPLLSPRSPRSALLLLAATAAVAVPVAGCGDAAGGGSAGADPAGVVPASAAVYAEAVVHPDGDLKAAVDAVAGKVLRTGDPGAEIVKKLDESLAEEGLSFQDDVEPWLGDRAGVAVTGVRSGGMKVDFLIAVASKDNAKAQDLVDQAKDTVAQQYKDVDYRYDRKDDTAVGIVGDTVVVGTERGFKAAVDASSGDALSERGDFSDARDTAGDDGLGFAFVDPARAIDLAGAAGEGRAAQIKAVRDALLGSGVKAVGASLDVEDDALRIDAVALGAKGGAARGDAARAAAAAPAGSWLALGIGDVGGTLKQAIGQLASAGGLSGMDPETLLRQLEQQTGISLDRDFLSWMGDATLFVRGTTMGTLGGALVVTSEDPAASKRAIGTIRQLLRGAGQAVRPMSGGAVDEGLELRIPQAPSSVVIAAKGDKFVVAYGKRALADALGGGDRLGDSSPYAHAKDALGGDVDPVFFLDVPQVVRLVEGLAGDDAGFRRAKPTLDAFGPLAAGSRREDDDKLRVKAGVQIR